MEATNSVIAVLQGRLPYREGTLARRAAGPAGGAREDDKAVQETVRELSARRRGFAPPRTVLLFQEAARRETVNADLAREVATSLGPSA
jgi:hypothetical protein